MTNPIVTLARLRLLEHLHKTFYANAYALILSEVVAAGLGVLFWLLAARLYSAEVVGQSSATISTIMFLASVSQLSLRSAMIRFVPRAGQGTGRLVLYTYGICILAAAIVSSIFLFAGNSFPLLAIFVGDSYVGAIWFVMAAMAWCIYYVEAGVLTGMRKSLWVLISNSMFNLTKICLLVFLFLFPLGDAIVVSWFLPVPAVVLIMSFLVFRPFMRQHVQAASKSLMPVTLRQVVTSVSFDHIGSILAEATGRVLPLIVLNLLGKSESAYFYQAFVVASVLYLIASSLASSFTVEASADSSRIITHSRRMLLHSTLIVVPLMALIILAAPLVLTLFGEVYAREGASLLRLLTLSALPVILNTWYLSFARVLGHFKSIIVVQSLLCILILGLSYWWLPEHGITSIGLAWLIGQTVVASLVAAKTARTLLKPSKVASNELTATLNQLMRRADWRFLSSVPRPRKSICFSDGLLAESVETISVATADKDLPPTSDCDLAVAVDPDQTTLKKAYRALSLDGACYTEWTAWRAGGASGVIRKIRDAGFSQVTLYWPFSQAELPIFWLPLPVHRANAEYLAARVFASKNLIHGLMRSFLVHFLFLVLRFGLVRHLSAVAYKDAEPGEDLFEFIRNELSRRYGKELVVPLSFLLQTHGNLVTNKIICLVFGQSDYDPKWIVKIPRVEEGTQSLRMERSLLADIHCKIPDGEISHSIPDVVISGDLNGMLVTGQTAVQGISLSRIARRGNLEKFAQLLTDWQISLARRSKSGPSLAGNVPAIVGSLASVRDVPGQLLDPQTLTLTQEVLSAMGHIPQVCAHNDFAPWNIVWKHDRFGVFDWDGADWHGVPMADLVYVLSHLVFAIENAQSGQRMLDCYLTLLDEDSTVGSLFKRCLDRYAREVGLLPSQIPPLRLVTWVLQSSLELARHKAEYGPESRSAHQNMGAYESLWTAELHSQLDHLAKKD